MLTNKTQKVSQGFTLVELMVVFLIIAILAAFAIPQYQEYVRQGRRAEAMSALMDGAQKLERYYSAHGTYKDGANLAQVFTTQIPAAGDAYYSIAGVAVSDTAFSLVATATGLMNGDKCGDFAINQASTQDNQNTTSGVTAASCWRH